MTTGIFGSATAGGAPAGMTEASPRVWWAIAMAALTVLTCSKGVSGLDVSLGDADDAARLLQVREFIAGASWFDASTLRMGGDSGLLSHWSRLIDLPIAMLLVPLQWILPPALAETIARAVWPLIVLSPLVWVMISTAHAKGGAPAAAATALLTLLCPLGLYQFAAGRIDHHNVMIAATVSAALLVFSRNEELRAWRLAGGLCGLALAIGYEALAPVAVIAGVVAAWGLADAKKAPLARDFTLVFIAAFAVLFAATVPPSRWMDIRCDAISLNMALFAGAGGFGLVLALGRGASWPFGARPAMLLGAGLAGAAMYGWLEPKCLAGPMGQLPAELKTVWLDVVAESRSIFRDLVRGNIEQSLALIAFFGAGGAAAAVRARASRASPDIFLLAVVAGFAALACWQYKYVAYASLICVVPIALAIARLGSIGELSAATVRFGAAVAISQAVLLMASEHAHASLGARSAVSAEMRASAQSCSSTAAIRDLAAIPPGRIAAHIDIGAFIPALTAHSVLSAPYHRIPDAILANHRILESRDDVEIAALLAREHVDYIVTCDGLDKPSAARPERRATLRARLINGEAPAFLTPVPLANASSMYRVWKVAPWRINPRL